MNRRDGFTLLEICLAVSICLLIVMVAVPSVRGAVAQQQLHRTFESFDLLVRKAQARSVDERRTYVLTWTKDGIDMIPWEVRLGEKRPEPEHFSVGEKEKILIERTAALAKKPDPVWTFWRSGTCEPVTIRYQGPLGSWVAKYDPLTAHGAVLEENLR